jgi:hypothetical protein
MNKKNLSIRNDLELRPTVDDIGLSEEDSDNLADSDNFANRNKG